MRPRNARGPGRSWWPLYSLGTGSIGKGNSRWPGPGYLGAEDGDGYSIYIKISIQAVGRRGVCCSVKNSRARNPDGAQLARWPWWTLQSCCAIGTDRASRTRWSLRTLGASRALSSSSGRRGCNPTGSVEGQHLSAGGWRGYIDGQTFQFIDRNCLLRAADVAQELASHAPGSARLKRWDDRDIGGELDPVGDYAHGQICPQGQRCRESRHANGAKHHSVESAVNG